MKIIIAGSRHLPHSEENINKIQKAIETIRSEGVEIEEIVSGGATGADALGEKYARENEIPLSVFRADWNRYGLAAGPIRNQAMAEYADACILFDGGAGTRSMRKIAINNGLTVFEV